MRRLLLLGFLTVAALVPVFADGAPEWSQTLRFDGSFQREWALDEGSAFELSVRIDEPSALPPNARIGVAWTGPAIPQPEFEGERSDPGVAAAADWQKTLHALDPDVYLVYRTPLSGEYSLRLETVTDRPQLLGDIPHDTGLAPLTTPLPTRTPPVRDVALTIEMRPLERLSAGGTVIEAEPNNAPEQAVDLPFRSGDEDQIVYVTGGADDIEYYNNTRSGQTPDDWYRIAYKGSKPKFVSANLQIAEPVVSARIRFYRQGRPSEEELRDRDVPNPYDFANRNPVPYVHPPAVVIPGPLPVYTYEEGRAINERAHQQDRSFRTFITRKAMPGETYYLRVEANHPAYEIEVRLFDPAPYDDPAAAVRQGVRYHAAEIDAWLIHRPRNIALHRRVRDATALFGENCMSCHTQSGVWGLADAFRNGYGPAGVEQSFRRLANTMYESLRLTNELEDAAVNTSVAPNDLGDGPAGTRVAGRNIVLHERTHRPKKLHRHWQQRTANYVLQTADPKGINAAGRGSNFGPNVVFKFGAEVLERAWRDTGDPRYFFGLEEKARKVVATGDEDIRVTDDLGHRIEFFYRLWPDDYLETVRKLTHSPERIEAARKFQQEFEAQVAVDMQRLLALQREDGGWGFDPGSRENGSDGWRRPEDYSYPAPTAVSLIALQSAGRTAQDPVVRRGVRWLLRNQYPYGLWNAAAATGFVTSAYAIRALSMLHPNDVPEAEPPAFDGGADLPDAVAAIRRIQVKGDRKYAAQLFAAVKSRAPQVRYHGLVGLGAALIPEAAPVLAAHLNDPVKSCREAAFWSLRQLLLDDIGWQEIFRSFAEGDDRTRQSVMHALVTRAYLKGADSTADLGELVATLTAGMVDPHPGVRAYAFKAAWHWWVWNPEIREPLNRAWLDALTRAEPEAQIDMALRYSTISLFVVNGQVNNITSDKFLKQQYGELADFYAALAAWREDAPPEKRRLVDRRLTAMAASHYMERANQQSPGQFAYSTPGASDLFGKAVLAVYEDQAVYEDETETAIPWRSIAVEGARNIAHEPLQAILLDLLFSGEREVVAAAARGLSNARELLLPAVPARLNPMLQAMREYLASGRDEDAEAVANFLAVVRWDFQGLSDEEEAAFFDLLLDAAGRPAAAAAPNPPPALLGRPAPASAPAAGTEVSERQAVLIARVLGRNQALHRREAFEHLSANPRLWLDSAAWMTAYREDGPTLEEALEGATEAEDLEIAQMTYGRTTEQEISGGIAGKNSALIWEDSKLDAQLVFALDVAQDGNYELTAAFLYGPAHGIVEVAFNDEPILSEFDGYRKDYFSTGPQSLGVFPLSAGENRLSVRILGSNPETEPEFKFGIDYVKLTPREKGAGRFVKDESGADVIDPIVEAKNEVIAMFVRWFDAAAPREARDVASRLAGSQTLRRNPEVLRAIAAFVDKETVAAYRTRLENILDNDDETYRRALSKLIRKQSETDAASAARHLTASDEFLDDLFHFRDYVFVEMNKLDKRDNRACISCHGVPGRVPTLYLHPPDAAGYIAPAELLENYRRMQERVDLDDPERSLFLRKPLNIQTGQEEGHQGGLRYRQNDPGFQVIRAWVARQAELQQSGAALLAGQ